MVWAEYLVYIFEQSIYCLTFQVTLCKQTSMRKYSSTVLAHTGMCPQTWLWFYNAVHFVSNDPGKWPQFSLKFEKTQRSAWFESTIHINVCCWCNVLLLKWKSILFMWFTLWYTIILHFAIMLLTSHILFSWTDSSWLRCCIQWDIYCLVNLSCTIDSIIIDWAWKNLVGKSEQECYFLSKWGFFM